MIHPLLNMTLRGIAWYQGEPLFLSPGVEQPPLSHRALTSPFWGTGEANTLLNTDQYNCTFPALIADWRWAFHTGSAGQTEPRLPFGFVQVWGVRGVRNPVVLGECPGRGCCKHICILPSAENPRQGQQWPVLGSEPLPHFPCASQLSAYHRGNADDSFARLRWHQTADLGVVPNARMPSTFMAVAMDLGDEHSPYGR